MTKQADNVEQLQTEIRNLEDQLKTAKENERLLVEYPDLHFVNNSAVSIAGLLIFLSHTHTHLWTSGRHLDEQGVRSGRCGWVNASTLSGRRVRSVQ